jgi:transposase-like protein
MSENKTNPNAVSDSIPDPELKETQPKARRYLTASYKLKVLREADGCKNNAGEVGALLRREGLYSSHLSAWRKEQREGRLSPGEQSLRGRKPNLSELEAENLKLRKDNEKLTIKLSQSQMLIEAQKKIAEIYETLSREAEQEKNRKP